MRVLAFKESEAKGWGTMGNPPNSQYPKFSGVPTAPPPSPISGESADLGTGVVLARVRHFWKGPVFTEGSYSVRKKMVVKHFRPASRADRGGGVLLVRQLRGAPHMYPSALAHRAAQSGR